MNKEFIPYEQALALKELGFDEPCIKGFYNKEPIYTVVTTPVDFNSKKQLGELISAPLYQQVFRWFREKYNWQHSIEPTKDQHRFELGYNYWIWNHITGEEHHTMPKNRPSGDWEYEIYEEAELACLIKLIEIVKEK